MVIFATSQIRTIFFCLLGVFLISFFSHETTLMRFLLYVFSLHSFLFFNFAHVTQRRGKKRQIGSREIVLFVLVFCFCSFFLASVHDKRPCIFLSIRT